MISVFNNNKYKWRLIMITPTGSNPTAPEFVQGNEPDTIIVSGKVYKAATDALPVKEEGFGEKIGRALSSLASSQIVQAAVAIIAIRLMYVAEKALLNSVDKNLSDDENDPESVTSKKFVSETIKDTFVDLRQSVVLTRSQLYVK